MTQWSPTTVRTYDLQFLRAKKELKSKMAALLKKTAISAMESIIEHNTPKPPYLTGSYISSHRVSKNVVDTSDTIYKEPIPLEEAKNNARLQLAKLKDMKIDVDDTIYISNSVGYSSQYGYSWARNVEYRGWKSVGPYLVYETAIRVAQDSIRSHTTELRTSTIADDR